MAALQKNLDNFKKIGKLSKDKSTYSFPTVMSKQRNSDKNIYWTINVEVVDSSTQENLEITNDFWNKDTEFEEGVVAKIYVISKLGDDGKVRDYTPTIVNIGKNIGKANQTNVFSQALIDANGQYTKKLRGVSVENDNDNLLFPPMLAADLKKVTKGINFKTETIWVDPKLNGVRFVAFAAPLAAESKFEEGEIVLYSRDRKLYYGLDYIREELAEVFSSAEWDFGKFYIDGEVYIHGMNLQDISGVVRRFLVESQKNAEKLIKLQYHIFDCFFPEEPELTYEERRGRLDTVLSAKEIYNRKYKYLHRVKSAVVKDKDELDILYKKFLDDGYEGAMIRLGSAPYEYSNNRYHSKFLIKMKPSFDDEYIVIGFTSGEKGKAAASLMLKMKTPSGAEFNVTPMGTIEERELLYKKFNEDPEYFNKKYLNKPLTVRYDELSKDGIPVRARAIALRDYE